MIHKNQRHWQAEKLVQDTIRRFKADCLRYHYKPEQILPHDSYLINFGHPELNALEKSK